MSRRHASTPPYVPRAGFRQVLDQLRSAKAGDALSKEQLQKRGISSHLIYPAIAALRFLGLIGEDDRLTGSHGAYDRDSPDRQAQAKLVRAAYGDFFRDAQVPAPDAVALKRQFQTIYDLSDRVVNSAFPLFQYLAQEAELTLTEGDGQMPILDEPRRAHLEERESDGESLPLSAEDLAKAGEQPAHTLRVKHTGYQIVINLQVTKYTTEKDLLRMIRTANRAVHLARKAGDRH